jgi:preprotein translocase SecE subunit
MKLNIRPKIKKAPKATETIRERANKTQTAPKQPKKHPVRSKIYRPLSVLHRVAKKEYTPVKLPQSHRWGRILGKRLNLIPTKLVNAARELREVNWPSRKDTVKLTSAVLVFALVFAVFVQIFGYGFEKLMKFILNT